MSNVDQPQRGWRLRGIWGVAVSLMVLAGLLVPILADSSASASLLSDSSVSAAAKGHPTTSTTICQRDPYTSSTVAKCHGHNTTTTSASAAIVLTISYSNGIVTWQACGYPSAAIGTPVQLYLAGHLQGQAGGRALVQAGGCAQGAFAICLAPALYPAVAVNQFGNGNATMRVDRSGCANPITLSGSSPLPGSSANGGVLPFTGANILLLLLTAAVLIVLGYGIVRLNRQRQRSR